MNERRMTLEEIQEMFRKQREAVLSNIRHYRANKEAKGWKTGSDMAKEYVKPKE